MLNVIYTIKACMLIMYTRLTLGLNVQKMVFYLAIYVAVGWASSEIAFFTACRPFVGYWAMPPPNPQCTTLQHYAIVQACFNISSDTLMLFIPLPLITRLNMPLKQKFVLMIIFSMGIFVILAAILTKVFNLSNIWDPSYMLWYTREASVAVYISNLPMIWPLLREWFPSLKGVVSSGAKSASKGNEYNLQSGNVRPRTTTIVGRHMSSTFGGKRLSDGGITTTIRGKGESTEELSGSDDTEMDVVTRQASWEHQTPMTGHSESNLVGWGYDRDAKDGGIHMITTVHISEEHVEELVHSPLSPRPTVLSNRDLEKGGAGFHWGFHHDNGSNDKL
jgi:hypothetical protein